jgi:hypothetical protein
MYFADLTAYSYTSIRLPGDGPILLNVGWLEAGQAYQRGHTPPELVTHLLRMATSYTVAMRGIHSCPFCRDRVTMTVDGQDVYLGNAELRARGRDHLRRPQPATSLHSSPRLQASRRRPGRVHQRMLTHPLHQCWLAIDQRSAGGETCRITSPIRHSGGASQRL